MSWDPPLPQDPSPRAYAPPLPSAPPLTGPRVFLHLVLFIITVGSTLLAGAWWHLQFVAQEQAGLPALESQGIRLLFCGIPFSFGILSILLTHEMGHYLMCRFYGIQATLPYVIPGPPPFGTFGAVIRIRSPFLDRRQLFDVGIAGPLAGFLVLLPVLVYGVMHSGVFVLGGSARETLEFGEPLLFRAASRLFFPGGPEQTISLHPMGWAAWFGMLATSLNLLPIGQLDGGHIVYALFGERVHRWVSYLTMAGLILVSLLSWPMLGYLVFSLVVFFLGFRHPNPLADGPPLGRARLALALASFIIFILTFILIPVRLIQHVASL